MNKSIGFLSIILFFFFAGCEEKPHQEDFYLSASPQVCNIKDTLDNLTLALVEVNLEALAKALSNLTQDSSFKGLMHKLVESQFDGDHNVLIRDLMENSGSYDLEKKFTLELNRLSKERNINIDSLKLPGFPTSFNNLGLFPQVYIPNFEQVSEESLPIVTYLKADNFFEISDTFNVIYKEGITKPVLIGEEFLKKNTVWLVSLSESVNCNGELLGVTRQETLDNIKSSRSQCPSALLDYHKAIEFYPRIRIKDYKESKWWEGKGEIMYSYAVWCHQAPTTTVPYAINEQRLYRSDGQWKIDENEENQDKRVHHHMPFLLNYPVWRDNSRIALVVYEHDNTNKRYLYGYNSYFLYYRSKNSYYYYEPNIDWHAYEGSGCWGCYTEGFFESPSATIGIGGWEP